VLTHHSIQSGVSLIELMIGLVIVAVLFALGAPSFSTFIQNSKVRNAAEAIQNGLSLARAEAVRRNTNVRFVLGTGSSWTVGCEVAVADLDGDGMPDCPGTSPAATTPSSIQAKTAATGSTNAVVATSEVVASTNAAAALPLFSSTLSFNSLGRVITTGPAATLTPGNNADFDITNPTGGTCAAAGGSMRCLRVVVTSGGQVRMCDPALTISKPSDPQAC
jgi:type IV fimbrial biogenesis protein FimT